MRKRGDFEVTSTLDIHKEKGYRVALAAHGVTLKLFQLTNRKYNYWRMEDDPSGAVITTGFDVDIDRALEQLNRGIRLEFVDLYSCMPSPEAQKANTSAGGGTGPFCVVCDTLGGLPCPNMVIDARRLNVRLAFAYDDPRIGPAYVHPGRCRKRLRQWIDTAQKSDVERVLTRHGDK